jgi:FMN phosphatase YigB (HAD superfamily)
MRPDAIPFASPIANVVASGEGDESIYSFDLFDTLVTRPFAAPTDAFSLMEGHARYRFGFLARVGFPRLRVGAEKIARWRSRAEDVSLVEIYRVLAFFVRNPADLLRREIQVEMALMRPIAKNVEEVVRLGRSGKRCCIVSDMYLPLAVVRRIVRRHVGDFDCHVSSKLRLTKASGALFSHVADHYGIPLANIRHTGDNPHSDQLVPRRLGATATAVPARGRQGRHPTLIEKLEPDDLPDDPLARLGYHLVGPCCAAFARFVGSNLGDETAKIVFGARDTYLIKEIFDRLYPGLDTTYFRISRRAVYLADYAVDHDPDRLFEGRIDASQFFRRIGLPCAEGLLGKTPRLHREEFLEAARAAGLDELAQVEREILSGYFDSLGFAGKVAYVDLGWRGSLQNAAQRIVGQRCELEGYYFGVTIPGKDRKGFYFQGRRPWMRYQRIFQAIAAFEFLFTEPAPSLKRVVRDEDGFSFEFLADESEEQIRSRNRIAQGCRRFFDDLMEVLPLHPAAGLEDRKAIDRLLDSHLLHPSRETVEALGSMWHSHSFGGSHRETLCPDGKFTLRAYLDSTWRSAYILAASPDSRAVHAFHRVASSCPGTLVLDAARRVVNLVRRLRDALHGATR